MIASLSGVLEHKDGSRAIINVGGLGFECLMSTGSLLALGSVGSVVRAETLLLFKNDTLALYGFASVEERALFESLTSVSGVGAKYALAILSAYAPAELTQIIQTSDAARLTAVSGIGKKTAQRILLELQGSLDALLDGGGGPPAPAGSAEAEAALALEAMGFSRPEIALALSGAAQSGELPSDASEIIRLALKMLG
ncbi:MAG: Holliday junction branch migration protein RuvA [Coriobacteriales bacterium]|jgi:Holliday junction DNA helicase RuvA|nr:Holliday junction branch migration protein RuvA [Coriobacteriales bacterium]